MDKSCVFARARMCDCLYTGNKCPFDCSFRQTPEQRELSQRKVNARLRHLPKWKQKYISDKYYDGDKPWWGAAAR